MVSVPGRRRALSSLWRGCVHPAWTLHTASGRGAICHAHGAGDRRGCHPVIYSSTCTCGITRRRGPAHQLWKDQRSERRQGNCRTECKCPSFSTLAPGTYRAASCAYGDSIRGCLLIHIYTYGHIGIYRSRCTRTHITRVYYVYMYLFCPFSHCFFQRGKMTGFFYFVSFLLPHSRRCSVSR